MIYLDNSATTAPFKEAADAVLAAFQEDFFNPSAAYAPAVRLHTRIEEGRARMLKTLNVENGSLLFTSGGTESNNFAIYGRSRPCAAGGASSPPRWSIRRSRRCSARLWTKATTS